MIVCCSILFGQNEKTVFVNSGAMYVNQNVPDTKCVLYIQGSFAAIQQSAIQQNGRTILKGNFQNNVTSGNVFIGTGTGKFEFEGDKVQYIGGTADKEQNYINFPELVVNNRTVVNNESTDTAAVVISSAMGVSTQNLSLYRGRLILDSKAEMNGTTDTRKSDVAHLLVNGAVSYDMMLGSYLPGLDDKNDRGIIQVKLALGDHYKHGYLIGFTPPFKKIYNDYFFYNFISKPTDKGLFGDDEMLITDPKLGLESGKGYIVGFTIIPESDPYYDDNWDPEWTGTQISDRFKETMLFARDYAPLSLSRFVNEDASLTDRYTGEAINTADVPVELKEGWNYIGNPFTVPINMSTFLDEASSADQWGVSRGPSLTSEVENKYYILTQGYGTYFPNNQFHKFQFDVTYLVAQKVGNTITLDGNPDSGLIAPMQLFVIKKNTVGNKNFIFPKDVRTHGKVKYLRREDPKAISVDNELLIETKDIASGSYDRLCVVFRDDAQMSSADTYDASKIFNESEGVNQIFTFSDEGEAMTTNVIPPSVEKLNMNLRPASANQELLLTAYRLNSITKAETVVLEDKKTGDYINLVNNSEYGFSTSPTDNTDRFVLHFRYPLGIEDDKDNASNIYVHYSNGELYVKGLSESNIGDDIQLTDIQGRVLYRSTVSDYPDYSVSYPLNNGVYILKISGKDKNPTVRKFMTE